MAIKTARRPVAAVETAEPRLGLLWAFALYALAVLALVHPALGGEFLVNPSSDQLNGTAYRYFMQQYFAEHGGFPHWNPYILGGMPLLAAQGVGDIFYPTFLARMVAPADVVLTWSFAVHLLLAGLFSYGLFRSWGIGYFGALVGGLAYMLSGKVASLVSPGHDGKMYVSALTPLLLWMLLLAMRDGRLWAWGVIALTTGLAILSPHFQLTYYLGYLAGAFALWLAFRKGEGALAPRTRWIRLGLAAGAAALGFGIAAVHFLPFFEYIPFSPRGGDRGWEYATAFSMPPEEILNTYLPHFSGLLERYWGRNFFKLHTEYLGAAVLLLAGASFGSDRRRGWVIFWSVVFVVGALWAFGGHTPFYRLVYILPMMSKVRAPDMIFFVPSFACAALAAVGVERLLAAERGSRYLIGWIGAAAAVALLATIGGFGAIANSIAGIERYDVVQANAGALTLGGWRSFLFVALAGGVLLAHQRGRVGAQAAGFALAVVVAADLWSVDRHFFRFSPPGSQLYAADPAIEYLQRLPEPGRTVAIPLAELEVGADPMLNGDGLMMHRIRTVTGHQGNEIQRWVELAGAKSPAPPTNLLNPQFRRLANVRYWYTNANLPETVPQLPGITFRRVVGPVRNAAGNTVFLYELAGEENPAAWVAPVIAKAPPEQILPTVLDARFDPRRAALFDESAPVQAVPVTALPDPSPIRARVTELAAGRMTVELDAPATPGSALVVSENYYPGWKATVDGREVPVGRADNTLIGVALPTGARRVSLEFTEQVYATGKTLTTIALVLTALLIAAGVVFDRRRRPAAEPPLADA